jgi:hypothetical protein
MNARKRRFVRCIALEFFSSRNDCVRIRTLRTLCPCQAFALVLPVAGTWLMRVGDYEDFALAIKSMCDLKRFDASIYVLVNERSGEAHAVVVGEEHGRMWMSSNGSFEWMASFEDVQKKVIRELGWFAGRVTSKRR